MTTIIPQRKQLRYKGYDYSQNGWYFVTICTEDKVCIFGDINQRKIILNRKGKIIQNIWLSIISRYNVAIDAFVIMPNHIHGIIIMRKNNVVGAGSSRPSLQALPTLGQIIGYFKYQSTKEINNIHLNDDNLNGGREDPAPTNMSFKKIWQRNYYDHIIRSEEDYIRIKQYIHDNPRNWAEDELNNER